MPTNKELLLAADALLRSTASYSGADIEAARGKLKHQMQMLQNQGRHHHAQRYVSMACTAQRYLRQHAWLSVALIALVGIAAGVCVRKGHGTD